MDDFRYTLFENATDQELDFLFEKYGISQPLDVGLAVEQFGDVVLYDIDNILSDEFLGGRLRNGFKKFRAKRQERKASRTKNGKTGLLQKAKEGGLFSKIGDFARGKLSGSQQMGNTQGQSQQNGTAQGNSQQMGGFVDNAKSALGILDKQIVNREATKNLAEAERLKLAQDKKRNQTMLIGGGIGFALILIVILIVVNRK